MSMYDIVTDEDGNERVVDAFSRQHLPDDEPFVLATKKLSDKKDQVDTPADEESE